MADETKNDAPPTREAAVTALDRMRTGANDDESDSVFGPAYTLSATGEIRIAGA